MLTLIQFISLFLMISLKDFPRFETPEFEGTPPWKIIEWGVGEDKTEVIPSTNILNSISLTQSQCLITDFPFLVPFFDRINNPHWRFSSTLTWDIYLKKFFYFSHFLKNFEGGNFLNFKRKSSLPSRERQLSDCFLNIADLKILAKSVFDYSPNDISFLFFKCESDCGLRQRNRAEDDCQSNCLFVSQKSCFDSNCSASNKNVWSYYFKKKESELSLIRNNLKKASGELRTHTVLFYYQTPCCRTVHQVTALVVIKKNEVFETCYLDSSGKQPIVLLKNVINSVFGNFPHVINYRQQSADRDDLSSFLVLAGARFLVNLYHDNLNYSNFPQVKLIDISNTSNYYSTKKNLKDSLIYAVVRSLWKESFLDLYSFGNLFCKEREKSLICYKNRGGSTETLDFLTFKENLVRKEKRLQDVLWLLWNKQQSIFNTDQFPFLLKLEKIFNLFPIETVDCWEKDLIWLQDSVIPQTFIKSPFFLVNELLIFDSEKVLFPIPKLNFLVEHLFSLLEEITRLHWEKSKQLFSKNFFSTRMLSAGEGPIIAELICNLPVECFLATDERTPEFKCPSGNMGNCITYHSRERPPRTNCPLFVDCSVSCISNPDISKRLLEWLKDVSQLQEKDWKPIPFIYFFFVWLTIVVKQFTKLEL